MDSIVGASLGHVAAGTVVRSGLLMPGILVALPACRSVIRARCGVVRVVARRTSELPGTRFVAARFEKLSAGTHHLKRLAPIRVWRQIKVQHVIAEWLA